MPDRSKSPRISDTANGPPASRLTFFVAAANLNAVLVLDARTGVQRGALPAGWRPTALALADSDRALLVANYRGEGTRPSAQHLDGIPDGVTPGSVQRIQPIPAGEDLAAATQAVARLLHQSLHEFAAVDP